MRRSGSWKAPYRQAARVRARPPCRLLRREPGVRPPIASDCRRRPCLVQARTAVLDRRAFDRRQRGAIDAWSNVGLSRTRDEACCLLSIAGSATAQARRIKGEVDRLLERRIEGSGGLRPAERCQRPHVSPRQALSGIMLTWRQMDGEEIAEPSSDMALLQPCVVPPFPANPSP